MCVLLTIEECEAELIELEGEIDKSTVIVGIFSTSLSQ